MLFIVVKESEYKLLEAVEIHELQENTAQNTTKLF